MTLPGIVLVHGYRGTPADLAPLAAHLSRAYGSRAVATVCLPGHGSEASPDVPFDTDAFVAAVVCAIDRHHAQGRPLVLIGHSTGGNLVLEALAPSPRPAGPVHCLLAVLLATPPAVDGSYLDRWSRHAPDGAGRLGDLAALVALVNRRERHPASAKPVPCPVLVVQGEEDTLVPADDATSWLDGRLQTPARLVRVHGAGHALFQGSAAEIVIDTVARAIDDALRSGDASTDSRGSQEDTDPAPSDARVFLTRWPHSRRHVLDGPAGLALRGRAFTPSPWVAIEPGVANIEITTHCNLSCLACARTRLAPEPRHMGRAQFERLLEILPHAFRIVLVGLGEPTLHPEVADFVRLANAQGRRVALVSNGMALGDGLARRLCDAGLASMTFSLDAADPEVAKRVRSGTDLGRVVQNLRELLAERTRRGTTPSKPDIAIFTALSSDTVAELPALVDLAASLGVDALMASDLNFASNRDRTVRASLSSEVRQVFRRAVKLAAARKLPLLSVHGLEALDIRKSSSSLLLFRAEQVADRSGRRAHCASPWQTAVVNVDGDLSICDCQPEVPVGNLLREPFAACWNGARMVEHRQRMLGDTPPPECLACPRF
jgi:MoaA/NifB/PqqE/SkfB family radical SAM enzyme/alpha-beta hydrolase superfamily lysophospholipase